MEQAKVKKIVRSQVEEQHFSKIEELEAKVVELKAMIVNLSKEDEQPTDVVEFAEVKPIAFNPENSAKVELVELAPGKSKGIRDTILEQIYK
jgi:hypothetical protein